MGFKTLWSNRPYPPPSEKPSGGTSGGCGGFEKEDSDRLTPKVTTSTVSGGAKEGDKVGDISGINAPKSLRKGF